MRSNMMLAALSALTLVAAQNQTFTIDPNRVDLSTRASWCQGENAVCNILCGNNPKRNDCDPNTLNYLCTCQNGTAPGLDYYRQSMPFFICNEAFKECNDANVGNAQGQKNCTTSIADKCGTLDPAKVVVSSSSSSSATPAPTQTQAQTSSGGSSSAASTSSSKAAAPTNFQQYGNGAAAVAMGLVAYML
ncbi:uncharacterized protein E0L32_003867 [Thyridium curvatum]|uniref:DUF7707 domain-containing protein n=1 Tax=Thyridium curvatum TaxID=1093900 RepID=A0A507BAD5_9PEZI|nr:uncharacterized protein E0L32_003867 [Thyridium curvatum]TPX16573.1 hypothetical protein E0L32_003867 [Thyridium curvatum]